MLVLEVEKNGSLQLPDQARNCWGIIFLHPRGTNSQQATDSLVQTLIETSTMPSAEKTKNIAFSIVVLMGWVVFLQKGTEDYGGNK